MGEHSAELAVVDKERRGLALDWLDRLCREDPDLVRERLALAQVRDDRCPICTGTMAGRRADALYCSRRCQVVAYNRERAAR